MNQKRKETSTKKFYKDFDKIQLNLYFISQICKLNVSKKDVKIVSEISEVTINKCFKKLEKIQDELLPAVIIKKYINT